MTYGRTRHHAERVFAVATDSSAAARSAIAASWVRSLNDYGLDPESPRRPERVEQARLDEARDRFALMLQAAEPALDRLFEAVGNSGCCILLTDHEAIPLARRGAPSDDDGFQRAGLWTGMVWDEAREGTNGIGTALAESRALTIHRDQHFFTQNTNLTCTAAPVYDHEGRLAGVLDVSSYRRDLDSAMVSLIGNAVGEAARRIEAAHFRRMFNGARILLGPEPDRDAGALLAVDHDDLVIGATRAARRLYGISGDRLAAGLPACTILNDAQEEDFLAAERGVVQRALARADHNVSKAARSLGLSRATLHRKMNRLGLRKSD
ncbi:GAF domain-containing protein [Phenylobacterium sp.]|uniref:GAF domain-containing protein n=1 Tax=Phenylobacterium sp. TaxID=1871053 RepID=UPI002FC7DBDE